MSELRTHNSLKTVLSHSERKSRPWRFPWFAATCFNLHFAEGGEGQLWHRGGCSWGISGIYSEGAIDGPEEQSGNGVDSRVPTLGDVRLLGLGQRLWGLFVEETNMFCSSDVEPRGPSWKFTARPHPWTGFCDPCFASRPRTKSKSTHTGHVC